jgi:hypothetical protein
LAPQPPTPETFVKGILNGRSRSSLSKKQTEDLEESERNYRHFYQKMTGKEVSSKAPSESENVKIVKRAEKM